MTLSPTTERGLHTVFTVSILFKGLLAFIETLSGIGVLFITSTSLEKVLRFFSQGELSENPNDFFVQYFLHAAHSYSVGGQTFAALYLLSHGVAKLVLVVLLLRKKLWAYPASIVVLWIFIAYQQYRYLIHPSPWLLLLTGIDLFVIYLIHHEYKTVKATRAAV
jgi:uncharacterized membrane protein